MMRNEPSYAFVESRMVRFSPCAQSSHTMYEWRKLRYAN